MMKIHEADGSDLVKVLEIYNSSRSFAGCFSGPPVDLEGMRALTEGEVIYLAEWRAQVVAFASVWAADSFIHHLYVLPDYQGQGIGSGLLEFCGASYGPLSLKCEVANLGAQRFYRNKGWLARESGSGDDGAWERLYSPHAQ